MVSMKSDVKENRVLGMKQEIEPCLGPQGRFFKARGGCFSRALTDEGEFHQARRSRGPDDGRKERRLRVSQESSPAH